MDRLDVVCTVCEEMEHCGIGVVGGASFSIADNCIMRIEKDLDDNYCIVSNLNGGPMVESVPILVCPICGRKLGD